MKKDFTCMACKPADMPCQVSRECKRQRREMKMVSGYGVDKGHGSGTPPKGGSGVPEKPKQETKILLRGMKQCRKIKIGDQCNSCGWLEICIKQVTI
jgi:hypothetical protein